MTVTQLGLVGANSATAAGTTLAFTNDTGAVIPAGTLIKINYGCDNIASVTAPTLTPSTVGGATPTAGHAAPVGSGVTTSAGAGIWHQCWRVLTTAPIAAGATVCTITSNQSAVKRAIVAVHSSGVSATLRGTVVSATSTAGTPSAVSGGTPPVTGDLVIGCIVGETNSVTSGDLDTLNGGWSAAPGVGIATSGGAANTNVMVCIQDKVVTAGGAQTYNPTTANDSIACIEALVPAVVVDPAPAVINGSVTFPGADIFISPMAGVISGSISIPTPTVRDGNPFYENLEPMSTITSTNWFLDAGSSTPHGAIGTGSFGPTDDTFTYTTENDPLIVELSNSTQDVSGGIDEATLWVRYAADFQLQVELRNTSDSSVVFTWFLGASGSATSDLRALSSGELASVLDWNEIYLQFTNTGTAGTDLVTVYHAYLEIKPSVPSGGVTATPGVISGAINFPATTPSAAVTPSPGVISGIADLPAVSVVAGTGALVTAVVIDGSVTIPAVTVDAGTGALPSPAVIDGAVTFPAATITAAADINISAAVISGDVSIPAPTVSESYTVSVTEILGSVLFPSAAAEAGTGIFPAVIAGAVTFPAATTEAGGVVVPAVIVGAVSLDAPTVFAGQGADISPAVIAGTVDIPSVGISAGGAVTATPSVIAPPAVTMDTPTVEAGTTSSPACIITAPIDIPSPSVAAGANAAPLVISGLVDIGVPAIEAPGTVVPTTIFGTTTVNTGTVTADAVVTPAVITGSVQVFDAAVSTANDAVVSPVVITGSVQVGAPVITAGQEAVTTPGTITGFATVPVATVQAMATVAAETILGQVVVFGPLVRIGPSLPEIDFNGVGGLAPFGGSVVVTDPISGVNLPDGLTGQVSSSNDFEGSVT